MPRSIDLSNLEKAAVDDEAWPPTVGSSSSEEGDSTSPMLGGAKGRRRLSLRSRWPRSPWMYLLDLFAVALIIIFWTRKPTSTHLDWQGDITGFVPSFSQQVVVFRSYPEFISNHTSLESLKEAREHWMNLLPRGQGYIRVDDTAIRQYDLPKPIEYKGKKSVGTSMMHSLHCLWEIMSEYDMLMMGLKKPPVDTWHLDHCYDYVRQMLMCGGDMALAGEDLPNGSSNLNVPHVCKNFDQMHEWLDSHRDNDAWQFGSSEHHYVPP